MMRQLSVAMTMANPPGSSRAYRTTIVPGIMVPWTRQSY